MKISINSIWAKIYILMTLFIFAFINFNGSTDFAEYTVPFIYGRPIVLHTLFSICILAVFIGIKLLLNSYIKLDVITICLLIKCILDFSHIFFNNELVFWNYFWHFACTLVSLIAYIIFSNSNIFDNVEYYKNILIIFGIIICGQVIYTFQFCGVSYFDLIYKIHMVIPYGGTNIIASILVPILALVFLNKNIRTPIKIAIVIVLIISIILTKSRGGMLLTLMFFLFVLYRKTGKSKSGIIRKLLLSILFLIFIFAMLSSDEVMTVFQGFTSGSSAPITLNSISSGRVKTVTSVLFSIKDSNILFGSGMQLLSGSELSGAHNFFVDLLARCGVVGTINYLILFIYMMKAGWEHNKYRTNPFFPMVLVIYINSLFEVCYFSYECDAMLWCLCGLMMGYRKSDYAFNDSNAEIHVRRNNCRR